MEQGIDFGVTSGGGSSNELIKWFYRQFIILLTNYDRSNASAD